MTARECILVTGGLGFIGSHFARAAIESGSLVYTLDLAKPPTVRPLGLEHVRGDVSDRLVVRQLLERCKITSIVHFAGRICVGESVTHPDVYFDANVAKFLTLLDVARDFAIPVVLSSSAAVYGTVDRSPIPETTRYAPTNPYGATKLAAEYALASFGGAYKFPWAALRYFNAAGAHPDGTMRENHDPETHLIPLTIDAALGKRSPLTIHGDGRCVRDYIHVCDLARAHIATLDALDRGVEIGAVNLGSGSGFSVNQVVTAVSSVIGHHVPRVAGPPREGDPPSLVADSSTARSVLGWKPERSDLLMIVEDAVRSRR